MAERPKLKNQIEQMVSALFNMPGTDYGSDLRPRVDEALADAARYGEQMPGPSLLLMDAALRKRGDDLLYARENDARYEAGMPTLALPPEVWDPDQPSATFKLIPPVVLEKTKPTR